MIIQLARTFSEFRNRGWYAQSACPVATRFIENTDPKMDHLEQVARQSLNSTQSNDVLQAADSIGLSREVFHQWLAQWEEKCLRLLPENPLRLVA